MSGAITVETIAAALWSSASQPATTDRRRKAAALCERYGVSWAAVLALKPVETDKGDA